MTVAEFIERLSKAPQEMAIVLSHPVTGPFQIEDMGVYELEYTVNVDGVDAPVTSQMVVVGVVDENALENN